MTRYVAIPNRPKASDDWENRSPIVNATTIYESEDEPERTGLLNADGTPLYRVKDKIKIGYL